MARFVIPAMAADDNIISQLGRVNLTPDDIDIVVNSHLHCDHCSCNEFFSKATIYVHRDELACARDPASEGRNYFQAEWDHPMAMIGIDGEVDIFDDGRLVLLPLPGHSPGMTGLLANLASSGAYLLASDAVAVRENLLPENMPQNIWNRDVQTKSIAEINRIEKSGVKVLCGHDLAEWSAFKKAEQSYS